MGKRGRNKTGYYRVLLHLLELQYTLERVARGDQPAQWRPSPRNRPDQFLGWVRSSLPTCGASPVTPEDLFARLEKERLPHVAAVLEHVVCARPTGATPTADFETLLSAQHAPNTEAHPQARKFSSTLSRSLDAAWLGALMETEIYAASKGWPASATLLGGLPPNFGALYTLLQSGLRSADAIETPSELSVFQFYGLATGTLPPPPAPYERALEALGALACEDAALLGSLSAAQTLQLRALEPKLLSARDSALRCVTCEPLDEELRRMIARKELSGTLVGALRGWDEALWREARAFTALPWATLYLEDRRSLQDLFNGRTAAKLNLRDVFPETVAWLDEKLSAQVESALYQETGGVAPAAHAYSCHLRKRLLEARRSRNA